MRFTLLPALLGLLWLGSCTGTTPLERACAAGHRQLREQQWVRAEREFERALRLRPGHAPALAGRSAARVGLTRYPEALADLDSALAAEPGRLTWRSRRGVLLLAMDRPLEGLAELDRVLAKKPDHAASVIGRAMIHLRLGRCPEAVRDFGHARRLGVPVPPEWPASCRPSACNSASCQKIK